MAHDRYGGVPERDRAQVLVNRRADGLPPLIVATPAYAPVSGTIRDQAAVGERLRVIFGRCIDAMAEFNEGERAE